MDHGRSMFFPGGFDLFHCLKHRPNKMDHHFD